MSARNSPSQLSFFIFNTPFIYFCLLGYLLIRSIMGAGTVCHARGKGIQHRVGDRPAFMGFVLA